MMRYELSLGPGRPVTVLLPAGGPDEFAPLEVKGHPSDVAEVEDRLFFSHGIDGRMIERATTPVDLDVAMCGHYLRGLSPRRISGAEILARYVRKDVR
ncbi:MAG: hypothetical protein AAF721_02560 [Myxococcota bacterium]